jgi:hypothetical protein
MTEWDKIVRLPLRDTHNIFLRLNMTTLYLRCLLMPFRQYKWGYWYPAANRLRYCWFAVLETRYRYWQRGVQVESGNSKTRDMINKFYFTYFRADPSCPLKGPAVAFGFLSLLCHRQPAF